MVELVRGAERGMLLVRAVGRLARAGVRDSLREARVCWCARRLEGEGSSVLVRVCVTA